MIIKTKQLKINRRTFKSCDISLSLSECRGIVNEALRITALTVSQLRDLDEIPPKHKNHKYLIELAMKIAKEVNLDE